MSLEFVTDSLPMDQGWALYGWSLANDGWLQFGGIKAASKTYIQSEIEKLMGQTKNHVAPPLPAHNQA